MESFKRFIVLFILLGTLIYSGLGFLAQEVNPLEWDLLVRILFVIILVALGILIKMSENNGCS